MIIREIAENDYPRLKDFLYHTIYLAPGEKTPPRYIIFEPEIFVYIDGFGVNQEIMARLLNRTEELSAWHGHGLFRHTAILTTKRQSLQYQFCRSIASRASERC